MPNPQVGDLIINYVIYFPSLYDLVNSSFDDLYNMLFLEPRTPEKPRVDVNNDGIKVFLVPTADQFGPIR